METTLYGFFIFLKENGKNSYFCITPKNQQFRKPTFPRITKKTNRIDISLTGTDNYHSKLSNKSDIHLLRLDFGQKMP